MSRRGQFTGSFAAWMTLLTLMLTQCKNLPFIDVLNPDKNPSKIVLCPKLEEITLYINHPDEFHIDELLKMAEGRALRGAKLDDHDRQYGCACADKKGALAQETCR